MKEKKFFPLLRTIEVIEIPSGKKNLIPKNTKVRITQALGGSFTIATEKGYMCRVDAKDADALGSPELLQDLTKQLYIDPSWPIEKQVEAVLKSVYDPEIPINVLDLGLVYEQMITPVENGKFDVYVKMTVTAPGCGMGPVMQKDASDKLAALNKVQNAHVELVYFPPWDKTRMSEEARLELGVFD